MFLEFGTYNLHTKSKINNKKEKKRTNRIYLNGCNTDYKKTEGK